MENNSLFPLKYRLRKTDELVEVIASETAEKGARNENDWVSYIDAQGNEHIKEHLTLEWDFVAQDTFGGGILGGLSESLAKMDPWESRRYELVKEFILKRAVDTVPGAVALADEVIAELKPKEEE